MNLPNETKDFQKYLKQTSNVYYDPTITAAKKKLKELENESMKKDLDPDKTGSLSKKDLQNDFQNFSPNYEYYSSIPVNSNLTSQQRGWNYSNRDNEFLTCDTPNWSNQKNSSQNSTLESNWSPNF